MIVYLSLMNGRENGRLIIAPTMCLRLSVSDKRISPLKKGFLEKTMQNCQTEPEGVLVYSER